MVSTASWYHCSVKVISRSSGRTAVAAAAYRSGERLHDNQLDKTYDYTRRRGVEASFIVAPEDAPDWTYNLEGLWNHAQAKDNRKNSCLAREVELALPDSLDTAARERLAHEFSMHLVERYGVACSVALHEPGRHGDDRNYHAHILFTTRRIGADGLGAKTRELDDRVTGSQEIRHIREYAATLINAYLEEAGTDERVDHRSYKERGIDQIPTEHAGHAALEMERRGQESERGTQNREIEERNAALDVLVGELAAIDAQIFAEMEKSFLPANREPEQTPETTVLTWKEQKAVAQSPFTDTINVSFEQEIASQGEVKEHGLGRNWFDRSVAFFNSLYYDVSSRVRNVWDRFRGEKSAPHIDDYEPDR